MIDASVGGISDRVRELHDWFKTVDITMRNAESAVTRLGDKVVGTNALLDKLERRINEIDARVDDAENSAHSLRLALYGDATVKDAPPSLYGLIQLMPAEMSRRFDEVIAPVKKQLEEQSNILNQHTTFIERRRSIENTVLGTVRVAVKNPLAQKLFWSAVAGGGVGVAVSVLLQLLGGG